MDTKINLRKKLVINKSLQLTVMISMLALADIVIYLDLAVRDYFEDPYQVLHGYISWSIFYFLALVGVLIAALIGSLYLSNRIAGPIHHLKGNMEKILKGDYSEKLEFRKGDYFEDIIKPYQQLVEKLSQLEKQKK